MPRYYVHVRRGSDVSYDVVGLDFVDLATALDDAVKGAREIVAEAARHGLSATDCAFEICDQAGAVITSVPFASTLRPSEQFPVPRADPGGGEQGGAARTVDGASRDGG